jgi:hypothetical protein
MARLYAWIENDKDQQRTLRANTVMRTQINYGTKDNSKTAVKVLVTLPTCTETPTIEVKIPQELKGKLFITPLY